MVNTAVLQREGSSEIQFTASQVRPRVLFCIVIIVFYIQDITANRESFKVAECNFCFVGSYQGAMRVTLLNL